MGNVVGVKGWIDIGRPSKWGNPFRVGIDGTARECVLKYAAWIREQPDLMAELEELRGYKLYCPCRGRGSDCHKSVLEKLLEGA